MEKNKIVALVCAVIAALLVIMAGRSCTESIREANEKSRAKNNESTVSYSGGSGVSIIEGTAPAEESGRETDIFGRVVTTSAVSEEYYSTATTKEYDPTETTTEPVVEYVTDVFGIIIGTETATSATATTVVGETETTATTTLSPLDQFYHDQQKPPGISGYNHGNYDEDGNPIPTLPPDFSIVIN